MLSNDAFAPDEILYRANNRIGNGSDGNDGSSNGHVAMKNQGRDSIVRPVW